MKRVLKAGAVLALLGLGACSNGLLSNGLLSGKSDMPRPGARTDTVVAVVGDLPYNDDQLYGLRIISDGIKEQGYPFAIHLGDYKSGGSPCDADTDTFFKNWRASFGSIPVFYTPGDNDWTDCDRESTGAPVSELERLETIRAEMFSDRPDVPSEWNVVYQDGTPENAQWSMDDVVFATLHVVGTNNGRDSIFLDDVADARAEVTARDRANTAWLDFTFERARRTDAKAIVLFQHADPTDNSYRMACRSTGGENCNGFSALTERLRAAADRFDRPVLLVHGDTAPYCMDKTFGGSRASNLWRLNGAGDYVLIDGVKLTIQPDDKDAPFMAESLLNRIPPAPTC